MVRLRDGSCNFEKKSYNVTPIKSRLSKKKIIKIIIKKIIIIVNIKRLCNFKSHNIMSIHLDGKKAMIHFMS